MVRAIVGANWGDEGKGKITDVLAQNSDMVIRFQGYSWFYFTTFENKDGSTQRIILDVTGRGFSEATCNAVKTNIWALLENVYPNIPIDIVGLV